VFKLKRKKETFDERTFSNSMPKQKLFSDSLGPFRGKFPTLLLALYPLNSLHYKIHQTIVFLYFILN
jgi:hypothetical protein